MSARHLDALGMLGVRAFLGPTNTGKTHRAIERMLRHPSGMIGLPLRLLAQEVYDRVVAARGEDAVALVTGEQKRVPPRPRYWVCTVEAMPVDRPVSFLAVDEVQLAGSPNRGHVFTDRVLHARGARETVFLGSDTIEPLLRALVPTAQVERFPRLSTLSSAGPRPLAALPPRSAVVAFAADEVYARAEQVRQRHGGTAVVLGALSPRARNAQVALYQSGEVQHLVATDAIGMGLNMDLDHVAFTALRKFDGRRHRDLSPAELAQIAGRAGRYHRDGSFGTLDPLEPMAPEVVEAIEQHRFPALRRLYWRNSRLDFSSLAALLASLDAPPPLPFLSQVRDWSDHEALRAMARDPALETLLRGEERLRLAWDVCQVPDYRKTLTGDHVALLGRVLRHLLGGAGHLPEDWVRRRIDRLDKVEGDIDALMTRMAWIRTWNTIAFKPGWLADAHHWQARCQEVEDRLSDALHARLTERFVTGSVRRVHVQGLPGAAPPGPSTPKARLLGLRYRAELGAPEPEGELLLALREELARRVTRLEQAPDEDVALDARGALAWEGGALGQLTPGPEPTRPGVEVSPLPFLDAPALARVQARLEARVARWVAAIFAPLAHPGRARLTRAGAQVVDAVERGLGSAPAAALRGPLSRLSPTDRRLLARMDLRLGQLNLYVASLFDAASLSARALLWSLSEGQPPLEPPAATIVPRDPRTPRGAYEALGYMVLGGHAWRMDKAEDLAAAARRLSRQGAFVPPPAWRAALGGDPDALARVLLDLGFILEDHGDGRGPPRARRA